MYRSVAVFLPMVTQEKSCCIVLFGRPGVDTLKRKARQKAYAVQKIHLWRILIRVCITNY